MEQRETRWVIFKKDPLRNKHFQLCKSNGNGRYYQPGTRKTMKGFNDIYNQERYNFNLENLEETSLRDWNNYRIGRGEEPIDLSTKLI